jgi:hypothetical protein
MSAESANEHPRLAMSLETRINKHDGEIAGIRNDMAALRKGQENLVGSMSEIKAFMMSSQANKPLPAIEMMSRYLGMLQNVGVLMGMVIASIIYVSSNASHGDLSRLRDRLDRIESGFELRVVPKAAPSRMEFRSGNSGS